MLDVEPETAQEYIQKGTVLTITEQYDDALDCFNKAISLEKHNIDFLLNKGVVLMELGKFEEAIDSFNKVLLRNPDNEDAFFLKEECLENL